MIAASMKHALSAAALVALATPLAQAQSAAPKLPDAVASDPVTLGWMVGSPPPADKVVRFADGSAYRFPQTRWSFSNFRQLVPTKAVPRGSAPASALPRAERGDLDAVSFTPLGGSQPMSWAQSLAANYTDGIVVLHKGRIVYERYFGVCRPEQPHILMSVTKSFVGLLAQWLVHEGALDETAPVTRYLPEMAGTAYDDARVRDVMDMRIGVRYSENYADPAAEVWDYGRAAGAMPKPEGYRGPRSIDAFLRDLVKEGPHGEGFAYKTVNTEVLGWIVKRVAGKPLAALVSERIWSRIGTEEDAYFTIDESGAEMGGGGLNATLRDIARMGEMMRCDGRWNGAEIVPKAVIDDIRFNGSPEAFHAAGYVTLPGWSYRNMWWVSNNPHGAYMARGIYGQNIFIDPMAEMVVARLGSHRIAANTATDPIVLPAYQAAAEALMAGRL